jgi:dCMP deaminase
MDKRPTWDIYFMLHAEIARLRSNCIARQVGCVIVKNNRQISTGYNGTPSGIKNCFDGGCARCLERKYGKIKSGEMLDRCLCTHAEANAIMQCAILGIGVTPKGSTLYSTYSPCLECSKMVISVGISKVVALSAYPDDGAEILREAKIRTSIIKSDQLSIWLSRMNITKK